MTEEATDKVDPVTHFMQEFLCRSFRVPPSKWQRMMATDSTKLVVEGFVEREFPQVILPKIILNFWD